jgi:hypothetical protein
LQACCLCTVNCARGCRHEVTLKVKPLSQPAVRLHGSDKAGQISKPRVEREKKREEEQHKVVNEEKIERGGTTHMIFKDHAT